MPIRGGKGRIGSLDNQDMGVGSGPQEVPGTGTCVTLIYAASYSKLSELATDSDEKAIENFATLTHQMATKNFAGYMDAWLQSDGSNTLDSVTGLQTSGANTIGFTVNNANLFQDDQDIDIWTAVGGAFIGTVTVQSVDILSNVIWLVNPIPTASVAIGNRLMMNGASGQANSGLFGLRQWQIGTNTGNWYNVQRPSYPGKFTTPTIAVNGPLLRPWSAPWNRSANFRLESRKRMRPKPSPTRTSMFAMPGNKTLSWSSDSTTTRPKATARPIC